MKRLCYINLFSILSWAIRYFLRDKQVRTGLHFRESIPTRREFAEYGKLSNAHAGAVVIRQYRQGIRELLAEGGVMSWEQGDLPICVYRQILGGYPR